MTCVVGIETEGIVWLGGDSSCLDVEGDAVVTQRGSKVFKKGDFVIGFAGSFQVGSFLRHKVPFPKVVSEQTLSTTIQMAFERADIKKVSGTETWEALIGYRDKLYVVQNDFYVYRHSRPYMAIGAAAAVSVAMGSFRTLERLGGDLSGRAQLKFVLETAEEFSANVRKPWRYTSTQKNVMAEGE